MNQLVQTEQQATAEEIDISPSRQAGGKISLVGIGPGSHAHMTQRARDVIAEADTIIGYVTYIKLVSPTAHREAETAKAHRG